MGLQLTVTAKKCFAFHNIRDKCMTHSNTSATIGYLKKVFLLNLSRSSRLDTISLLKLSRTYQFYKDIHLIVHQMKECTVEFFRRSNGYSCSAQLAVQGMVDPNRIQKTNSWINCSAEWQSIVNWSLIQPWELMKLKVAKYTSMFFNTSSPRYKCMIHSNISATIGYLKKVFMLNLNRSSRLDTISLLKLSGT